MVQAVRLRHLWLAQGIEQETDNLCVAGSTPAPKQASTKRSLNGNVGGAFTPEVAEIRQSSGSRGTNADGTRFPAQCRRGYRRRPRPGQAHHRWQGMPWQVAMRFEGKERAPQSLAREGSEGMRRRLTHSSKCCISSRYRNDLSMQCSFMLRCTILAPRARLPLGQWGPAIQGGMT